MFAVCTPPPSAIIYPSALVPDGEQAYSWLKDRHGVRHRGVRSIGGPGAGSVLGNTKPLNWSGVWVFGGVTTCVAGVAFAGLRTRRSGLKVLVKA